MTNNANDTNHVTDTDLGNKVTLREMDIPAMVAEKTETEASDWEEIDGPESGVGVDYWYAHKALGWQAYVLVDQDDISISVMDSDGDEVYTSEEN